MPVHLKLFIIISEVITFGLYQILHINSIIFSLVISTELSFSTEQNSKYFFINEPLKDLFTTTSSMINPAGTNDKNC